MDWEPGCKNFTNSLALILKLFQLMMALSDNCYNRLTQWCSIGSYWRAQSHGDKDLANQDGKLCALARIALGSVDL
jgi:hypothetical protein